MSKRSVISAGFDAGTANFGVAVVDLSNKNSPKLIGCGMLPTPIKKLVRKNRSEQVHLYEKVLKFLCRQYKFSICTGERFQTRGGGASMGLTIELISGMLAIAEVMYRRKNIEFVYVIAGQWKTAYLRQFGKKVDDLYLKYGGPTKASQKRASHRIDAILIAIYGGNNNSFKGIKIPVKFWKDLKNELRFA